MISCIELICFHLKPKELIIHILHKVFRNVHPSPNNNYGHIEVLELY